jgi:hypothetical protein
LTSDIDIGEAVEQALVDDILDDTMLVADEIIETPITTTRYIYYSFFFKFNIFCF